MKPTLLLAAACAAATLAACGREPAPHVETPRPVRSIVAQPQATSVALTLPAEVRPRIESRLGFRVGGKIAERTVSVGDRVAPGQVLARLDPQDVAPAIDAARAQVEAASTDLELARADLKRTAELHDQRFVSQAQLDRQKAVTDAAAARLRSAQAQLDQAANSARFQALVADAAGVVTAVEAEPGQVVSAGQPVIRIARAGDREILAHVPEVSLPLARSAASWTVVFPALGGREVAARVRELSPIADPASRTYAMRLVIEGDAQGIELGMTAVARALRETAPAIVVPLSALYSQDGNPQVWVVGEDSTVRPVPVQTAGIQDETVRIVRGLSAGDRVVTAGASLLVPGQKVRVVAEAAPAAEGAAR